VFTPRFALTSFETLPLAGRVEVLGYLLEALAHANVLWLRANPGAPLLYSSGVRYAHEAPGVDDWQDIPRTLAVRSGDCEDLAGWRVAELRHAGQAASFDVTPYETPYFCDSAAKQRPCTIDFHIRVIRADGTREDPSRILGMR
jgi:hypothetical protein